MHAIVDASRRDFLLKSSTLLHVRIVPAAVLLEESVWVWAATDLGLSTAPSEAETMQWAHGYSGCMGVSMNGVHPVSRSVASLPSISPFRIAVIGRQKL